MQTARLYVLLGLLLVVAGSAFFIFHKGGSAPRAELKVAKAETRAAQAEVQAVAASVKVSQDTAAQVDVQGAEVRQKAAAAKETIHEAISRDPAGTDPAGDAAVVREAEQAYDAAIRAACRVQRENSCDGAAATP